MKKIGIISLFTYNNYGNRLQLFAVQQIYKDLGFATEIIKFKVPETKDSLIIRVKVFTIFCLSLRRNLQNLLLQNKRENNFKKHAKTHYFESEEYVNPLAINEDYHKKFCFLSVGSDQIWGWFMNVISDFVFLKFSPREKRITFSPSFGSSILEEKYHKKFREGLEGFNNISIREESGAELIKKLSSKKATVICDPTICLSKNEWLDFAKEHHLKPKRKYILTYFLGSPSEKAQNILLTFSNDYEIIELNSFKSPKFYAVTPSEWVDYVNGASLFLTDSFHGVVFSIVLQTPFAVFSRIGGESMQTRVTNILNKFNMESRYEINIANSDIFAQDFSIAEETIHKEKLKALDFLKKSVIIEQN